MLYFAKWKITAIVLVVVLGALYALPNLLPSGTPDGVMRVLPSSRVNLGLDLAGGAHLLYEVDVDKVRDDRVQQGLSNLRQTLRREQIVTVSLGREATTNDILVEFPDIGERDAAITVMDQILIVAIDDSGLGATEFTRVNEVSDDGRYLVRYSVTDAFVRAIQERTIRDAQSVIGRRINSLGVTEPTIQSQGTSRILVEAPGVDSQTLKDRVGTTAKLTFQLVTRDDLGAVFPIVESGLRAQPPYTPNSQRHDGDALGLARAVAMEVARLHPDDTLRREEAIDDIARVLAPVFQEEADTLVPAFYAGYFEEQRQREINPRVRVPEEVLRNEVYDAVGDVLARALLRRVPADDGDRPLVEALASAEGELSARVQVARAVFANLTEIVDAVPLSAVLINLSSTLVSAEGAGEPFLLVAEEVQLTGEELVGAEFGQHPTTSAPIVNFRFNGAGAAKFCSLTRDNLGERFASILDGVVISAPNMRTEICGGQGYIEGNFTRDSASELAALLSAGALPADLTVVQESTVGPQMGEAARKAGIIALAIGFIAVIVFMVYAYRLFGLFAVIALMVNLTLIVAILSVLGAALTLPGIAGIILTVGMAVDANVLIFERIREELKNNRSPVNAIEAGYLRARTTILDANITTLGAAVVLFWAGSGPVQGFAVTLGIGIVTSVFTAFVVSRALVAWWFTATRPSALPV